MVVDATLCQDIVKSCEALLSYSKPLIIPHCGSDINVTCAVGPNARSSVNVPQSPISFPTDTYYCFDENLLGSQAFDLVAQQLAECCTD